MLTKIKLFVERKKNPNGFFFFFVNINPNEQVCPISIDAIVLMIVIHLVIGSQVNMFLL